MTTRPNILFLMSDQHRADMTGFGGNAIVRTPVLDRLAADAVVFQNAYTPSPICVPARQAMMSGQFPRTNGCQRWGDDLEPFATTFAARLSQYAYRTVCCGKLHHLGLDQNQGWMLRIGYDNDINDKYIKDRVETEFSRYQGESKWWPWEKEVKRAGVGTSPYLKRDNLAVDGALQVIDEHFSSPYYDHEKSERPLMLKVSLTMPHYPYLTDEEAFTYYLNRVPTYFKEEVFDHPIMTRDWDTIGDQVTEREVRRATAAYYGMTESLDSNFGKVIERLEHLGQNLDDWIILYTSDHGDMLGEHGVWMKYKYFDSSARVPLFIRWPKNFGSRIVPENVSLCDLYATLCDLTGVPVIEGLDSRSLAPLMGGTANGWSNESISQLDDTCMIKQDQLKYQFYGIDQPEVLFDLAKDPGESCNRADDPVYAEAMANFRCRLNELGYPGGPLS